MTTLVGDIFEKLVKERNTTQKSLAKDIGVDPSQISRWKRGQDIGVSYWADVAEKLDVHPAIIYLEPTVIDIIEQLRRLPPDLRAEAIRILKDMTDGRDTGDDGSPDVDAPD